MPSVRYLRWVILPTPTEQRIALCKRGIKRAQYTAFIFISVKKLDTCLFCAVLIFPLILCIARQWCRRGGTGGDASLSVT